MKDNMRFVAKGLSGLNLLRTKTYADACKGYSGMWLIAMLLVVLMAGCNGNDPSLGGGGTTGPTVSSTVPAAGASGVAINTTITANFSVAMDPATITTTTFTVTTGSTAVTGTVAASGQTATFTPDADLTADTLYTATITTGAKDLNGNALAADKVWTFTTGTAASPTVLSTFPADLATGVARTADITATFSQAMASATINTTTFTLTPAVTGTVALAADGVTAVFTPPAGGLAASTLYVARITTGVTDVNGNHMAADKVWSFTTGL